MLPCRRRCKAVPFAALLNVQKLPSISGGSRPAKPTPCGSTQFRRTMEPVQSRELAKNRNGFLTNQYLKNLLPGTPQMGHLSGTAFSIFPHTGHR